MNIQIPLAYYIYNALFIELYNIGRVAQWVKALQQNWEISHSNQG